MKKKIHPKRYKSLCVQQDKSVYKKKSVIKKQIVELNLDFTKNTEKSK